VTIIHKQKLIFVFCRKHALQFAQFSWFLLDCYALSNFLFVVSVHLTRGVKKFDDAQGEDLIARPLAQQSCLPRPLPRAKARKPQKYNLK